MKMIYTASAIFACMLSLCMCGKVSPDGPGKDEPKIPDPIETDSVRKNITLTPFFALNRKEEALNNHAGGACERSSVKLIQSSYVEIPAKSLKVNYPAYPRISVMPDGSYLLTWQQAASASDGNGLYIHYAKSADLKTWEWQGYLWKQRNVTNGLGNGDTQNFTNGNTKVLRDGRVMAVGSFRTVNTYTHEDLKQEHGIMVKFSEDNGVTWSDEIQAYWGPNWEPDIIERPDGELQIYFADPRPWISSAHSGTSMVYSNDGGKTWSPGKGGNPYYVMRSQYYAQAKQRYLYSDQMPVGVCLNGTDRMAFAVEVVTQWIGSQYHQISIVYSPEDGKWDFLGPDDGPADCPRLDNIDGDNDGIGPYLVQFNSGETVVLYTQGNNSKLFCRVGDENASNFQPKDTNPLFPRYGGWQGAKIESNHTLLVANKFSENGNRGIAVARVALNHDIDAADRTAELDADNSEWSDSDDALYLGINANIEATIRVSQDKENVYFLTEVADQSLSDRDRMTLFIQHAPVNGDIIPAGSRKYIINSTGLVSATSYASGKWDPFESHAKAVSAYEGTVNDDSDKDKGYFVELAVPKTDLTIQDNVIVLNAELYDAATNKTDKLTRKVYVRNIK